MNDRTCTADPCQRIPIIALWVSGFWQVASAAFLFRVDIFAVHLLQIRSLLGGWRYRDTNALASMWLCRRPHHLY
jgi:hypothetical protein